MLSDIISFTILAKNVFLYIILNNIANREIKPMKTIPQYNGSYKAKPFLLRMGTSPLNLYKTV